MFNSRAASRWPPVKPPPWMMSTAGYFFPFSISFGKYKSAFSSRPSGRYETLRSKRTSCGNAESGTGLTSAAKAQQAGNSKENRIYFMSEAWGNAKHDALHALQIAYAETPRSSFPKDVRIR